MKLPDFIESAIANNTTSLGTHPAFPPDEEESFIARIIKAEYDEIMKSVDTTDRKELATKLDDLVTECKKIESTSKEALEKLCSSLIAQIFEVPDDTIDIRCSIVDECNMDKFRMTPEPSHDYQFEDIDEMKYLSDMVYKRRMTNVLMTGISMHYVSSFSLYANDIYKINPELMNLYVMIDRYNKALLFNQRDTIKNVERSKSGCVSVNIGNEDEQIIIEAEGVIFPILLEQTVRGLLEVASLKGLPKENDKAEYITTKADYRLAENWDMRLGMGLYPLIAKSFNDLGFDIDSMGSNFVLMEICKLEPDMFNDYLSNVFMGTRKGSEMSNEIAIAIKYNKELDDFDNYVKANNSKANINDSEYTSEELLSEAKNYK